MVSGKKHKRITVLLLAENAPEGRSWQRGTGTAGIPFCGTASCMHGQQAPLQGGTAAIIRKGDISIEVAASASTELLCGRRI